jgi:hypothetical protein
MNSSFQHLIPTDFVSDEEVAKADQPFVHLRARPGYVERMDPKQLADVVILAGRKGRGR